LTTLQYSGSATGREGGREGGKRCRAASAAEQLTALPPFFPFLLLSLPPVPLFLPSGISSSIAPLGVDTRPDPLALQVVEPHAVSEEGGREEGKEG